MNYLLTFPLVRDLPNVKGEVGISASSRLGKGVCEALECFVGDFEGDRGASETETM